MESITLFITHKLKLKVNETKSAVARPQQRKFLGFSFTDGPEIKRTIARKGLERFNHRIREVTLRAKGVRAETTIAELASYLRGWRSYFGSLCADSADPLGPAPTASRYVAAMENTPPSPSGSPSTGGSPATGQQRGWQRTRPLVSGPAKALSLGLSNAHFKSLGLPTLIDEC
jgi:RNA-directed DNA polymerase